VAGGGYEVLGSDNGHGFETPLATLHPMNGWADLFVPTPDRGLRDLSMFVEVTIVGDIPLRVIYHKYDSVSGSDDFGHELDAIASKKLGEHWTTTAKYAYYDGVDAFSPTAPAVDLQRFWLQLEFDF
jgi:hypothetical protein